MTSQRGFTLLEALVVLVLVALVAGVLVDGASRMGDLRQRLAVRVEGAPDQAMRLAWFRQSIASALPDLPGGRAIFRGDTQAMTLLTTAPLQARLGVPTPVAFRIVARDDGAFALEQREDEGAFVEVARWRGGAGGFAYLDGNGAAHARWPEGENAPQLPAAVLLQSFADQRPALVIAAVAGARDVPKKLLDAVQAPQ